MNLLSHFSKLVNVGSSSRKQSSLKLNVIMHFSEDPKKRPPKSLFHCHKVNFSSLTKKKISHCCQIPKALRFSSLLAGHLSSSGTKAVKLNICPVRTSEKSRLQSLRAKPVRISFLSQSSPALPQALCDWLLLLSYWLGLCPSVSRWATLLALFLEHKVRLRSWLLYSLWGTPAVVISCLLLYYYLILLSADQHCCNWNCFAVAWGLLRYRGSSWLS